MQKKRKKKEKQNEDYRAVGRFFIKIRDLLKKDSNLSSLHNGIWENKSGELTILLYYLGKNDVTKIRAPWLFQRNLQVKMLA